MARTVRDLPISGRTETEAWNTITEWMRVHGGWIEAGPSRDANGTYAKVQMGVGVWQLIRYFDIWIRPMAGGVVVHTEGYVRMLIGGEKDLNPSALDAALPRLEGYRVLEDLWNRLAYVGASPAPPPHVPPSAPVPAPAPQPPPGIRYCARCGAPFLETASFCSRCGAPRT